MPATPDHVDEEEKMQTSGSPFAQLRESQELHEHAFVSKVPIVGNLIVWFRTQWVNIGTRWYVLPLLQQQSTFNRVLVNTLESLLQDLDGRIADLDARLAVVEETLANLDVDQVTLARDVAETRYQVIRIGKALETIKPTETTAAGEHGTS